MMTLFRAALGGAFLTCIGALSVSAEMNDTEEQLFRLLKSKSEFLEKMPEGREPVELVFKGRTVAGPLEWGVSPTEIEIKPVGIRTHVARNCTTDTVLTVSDFLQAEYESKHKWELTAGIELTNSVEVTGGLPAVASTKTTNEIKMSFNGSKGGETSTTQKHSAGYSVPVKQGRELDVQLQVVEQIIEGTPFSIEMELLGDVEITHPPSSNWVRVRGGEMPSNVVIAGEEKTADETAWRDLIVCRAAGTPHIGKKIGNECNYGYGGEERSTTEVEVLVIAGLKIDWVSKATFESDNNERLVAEGDAPVYYGGQENRPTGRYKGRTFVCRSEHKDNFHPGKVVGNHCMIGYGGDELEKDNYEVLLRGNETGNETVVSLQKYLDRAERSFVVEGIFEDARALSATTVLSASRPVSLEACPDYVAPQETASVRDADVEIAEPVTVGEGGASTFATSGSAGRPAAPDVEQAITGTALAEISFGRQVETRARLVSRPLRDLAVDIFGANVVAVQQALNDAGGGLEVDGYYGPKTARALRAFQRANGLLADGVFGPASQAALGL